MPSVILAGTAAPFATATRSVTLTEAILSGDHLVVTYNGNNTLVAPVASGAGATWGAAGGLSNSGATHWMVVGAAPTAQAAGAVVTLTDTTGAVRGGRLDVYILRGMGANPVLSTVATTSAFAASLTGPTQSVPADAVAFGLAQAQGRATMSWPATQTPSGAWTLGSSNGEFKSGYATPAATANHSTTLTCPTPNTTVRISQGYVTADAVSGDRTGTVAATLPKLSAASTGTVLPPPRTGVVSASLPKLSASATGSFTPPARTGTVAAALPALSAFVDGSVVAPGAFAGSVDATLPKLGAAVTGGVSAPDGVSGTVNATLPAFTASVGGFDTSGDPYLVERHYFPGAANDFQLGTSNTVTFTSTPQPGDIAVVVLTTGDNTATSVGVTGLGADWTVMSNTTPGDGQEVLVVGTALSTAGAVTVSLGAARPGVLGVYIVRHVESPFTLRQVRRTRLAGATHIDSPVATMRSGEVVFAAFWTDSDNNEAWVEKTGVAWTNVGWQTDYAGAGSVNGRGGTGFNQGNYSFDDGPPRSIITDGGTETGTYDDPSMLRITHWILSPVIYGNVNPALPALSGAVAGAYTQPPLDGTVAATLPALTATARATFTPPVIAEAWTLDDSQIDLALVHDDDPVLALVEAPPATIPAELSPRLITRQSHQLNPAELDADPTTGARRAPGTHTVITEDIGYPHIWVDGQDVTYFGGARTRVGTITSSTPGGDGTTSLTFPTLTSLDQAGVGEWGWLRPGALVDIALVSPAGVRMTPHIFNGSLVSDEPRLDTRTDAQTWAVVGTFAGADVNQRHRAPIVMNRIDLGLIIPRVLNKVVGRSFGPFASVRTDIRTNSRGTYAQSVWQYVSDLLARAWTTNGRQWTIRRTTTPRQYELALRDTTTTHWTVTAGAYGVEVDLDSDYSETYNVVYGHGIARDGYYWGNWKHPALSLVAPPAYPFNDPSRDIDVGTTDDDTDTGDGVTTWQRRMKALGYAVTVDGVYSAADETQARKIQKDRGLHVGGGVGPQTWVATFDEGTTGADLSKSYRAPLAWLPEVEPYLYSANGAVIANNPAYNPAIERRESEDIDFGTGRSKAEGVAEAEAMLARNSDPGWVGTVTLRTDPWEGSRWFMFEDQNVMLLGHRGENRLLHIVGRSLDPESGQVTLTVDSKFRDALTVQQIRDRNKESRLDPARRPGNANRRSRLDQDILVPFDGESGAGHFYKRPVNGDAGLWSVVPVFISEAGQLVRVSMRSSGPASKFWVALFGSEKTANWMAANVGDPGAAGAWDDVIENGDNNGLIEQWGNDTQACGETPGGSVNGRFEDTGGVSYYSTHGGWVWVAVYADESCFLEGRFYPAPIQ